mmetsp:Transcript_18248/g.25555  ORF Transcript_18248/g.25555 Transcript_18248/m.25555 type:complete len:427 (+) Transcript_18248:103-1383(+)
MYAKVRAPSSVKIVSVKNHLKNTQKHNHTQNRKFHEAVIVSAVRTPIGSIGGTLASLTGPQLGAIAIKEAVNRSGLAFNDIQEVYMGNVLQAGEGQAPVRQAVLGSGLPNTTCSTTINKVCASGMKSVMLAAQNIMLGQREVMVAGGFESMSNVPFYLDKARYGYKYGHGQITDGILKDGLWDVYNDFHMGNCAEDCAKKFNITRQQQDEHAIESYKRAKQGFATGFFSKEIVPVSIQTKKGEPPIVITEDEEFKKVNFDRVPSLRPAFDKHGTVTAANSSKLNDGAAALVVASAAHAKKWEVKPIARILGFGDSARLPVEFTIAPATAIEIALKRAHLSPEQVDYYEINEAFSVVALANNQLLKLNPEKVNVFGGAVALGHPIGASGARIIVTLLNVLQAKNGKIGVAAICNGGGEASAIVVERL